MYSTVTHAQVHFSSTGLQSHKKWQIVDSPERERLSVLGRQGRSSLTAEKHTWSCGKGRLETGLSLSSVWLRTVIEQNQSKVCDGERGIPLHFLLLPSLCDIPSLIRILWGKYDIVEAFTLRIDRPLLRSLSLTLV